jgi:peptidoglycan/xylan/chitin deacetylase (PgdA/CDA1 family)
LFAAQIEAVARRGSQTIAEALLAVREPGWLHGDRVVVTFDDGTADFADIALPILVEHRVPAVLYVATDFIESQRSFPQDGKPLSWAAIRDALATGLVTLGSHTHSHALLDRVDAATAADELDRSLELLYERAEVTAAHFAYPKALAGNDAVQREVRSRFRSAAVAGTRPNRYGATDPWLLARSPVQRADGMEFFEQKLRGGLRLEDDFRRLANRVRYMGAQS